MPEVFPRAAKFGEWVTYLPFVKFTVTVLNGICDTSVIYVEDCEGDRHYLRVCRVEAEEENRYLPIKFIRVDQERRLALIELPMEADSGTRRLWVRFDQLKQSQEQP